MLGEGLGTGLSRILGQRAGVIGGFAGQIMMPPPQPLVSHAPPSFQELRAKEKTIIQELQFEVDEWLKDIK